MSRAPFSELTHGQPKLLRADENEGCSQNSSSKCTLHDLLLLLLQPRLLSTCAVCGDLSGAKRLVMAAGSASKRRALAELGNNIPLQHAVGQRKGVDVSAAASFCPTFARSSPSRSLPALQVCAPPQVAGPFPLTSTIWSTGGAFSAQPASLTEPREACLWGECTPHPTPPRGLQYDFLALQVWSPCSCLPPPKPGAWPLMLQ